MHFNLIKNYHQTWPTILKILLASFIFSIFLTGDLHSSLIDDKKVVFITNFGQNPFGTEGDPNQPGGLSDSGNSISGTFKATLTVDSATRYRVTMDTAMLNSTLFVIEEVDWGSGGTIDTVSIVPQTDVTVVNKTSTTLFLRITQPFNVGDSFFVDVTGVHVPEPRAYIIIGSVLASIFLLSKIHSRRIILK